jgi:hypothetical protein
MPGITQTLTAAIAMLILAACANTNSPLDDYEQVQPAAILDPPEPLASGHPAGQVERGRYLVALLGCGSCHTDGALIGAPNGERLLAGSQVGIAWSNPLEENDPGVVYPSNLTPDPETGIGNWGLQDIVTMLLSGVDSHGSRSLPVMPWLAYSRLLPEDATAIAMYLGSLPPVKHRVPANVDPGRPARAPYIHFGIYRNRHTGPK